MTQNALQDIHYQIQLLRAAAAQESWIMVIQTSPDQFFIAGSGAGGAHEFIPYLMPDLTCYVLLLQDVPVLDRSRRQQQCILVAYQGFKSLLPPDICMNTVQSPQFKVIFYPYSIVLYSNSQKALQQQLYFDTQHPSYKSLFQKLPVGFQILTAKERHLQPYNTAVLYVNTRETERIFETVRKPAEQSKQLKRKQTRPNAQLQQMIYTVQQYQVECSIEKGVAFQAGGQNPNKSPARAFQAQNDFSDISDPEIDDSDLMKYMSSLPNQNKPSPKRGSYNRAKMVSSQGQAKNSQRYTKIARVDTTQEAEELKINFSQMMVDYKTGQIVQQPQQEQEQAAKMSASDSAIVQKRTKQLSNKQRFYRYFQKLQEVIPDMQNEKKRKYNITLATAVEHCIKATQNEMPERTKMVQQALARVSLQEVVMLGIQNGSSVTNLSEALAVLKTKLPARQFEILKLVTASSKSLNTEEVCIGQLNAWVEYLELPQQ